MRILKLVAALAVLTGGVPAALAPALAEEQQSAETARIEAAAAVVQRSLDAWRAGNFEAWIANYSSDVVVSMDAGTIMGRAQLRSVYKTVFDMNLPDPEILDSGWTGERIWVRQREFGPDGGALGVTYAEYEVRGGKIVSVYGVQTS